MLWIIVKQDYKSKINQRFLGILIMSLLWMTSLYLANLYVNHFKFAVFLIRLANGFALFAFLSILSFIYHFPRKTFHVSNIFKIIILASGILIFIVELITPLIQKSIIVKNGEITGDILGILYPIFPFTLIIYFFLIIFFTIKKIKKLDRIEKRKMKIVLIGIIMAILSASITNAILPLFNIYFFQKESPVFLFFAIIPMFYAMIKYRFFDLSYISLNILRNLIFLGGFFIIITIYYFIVKTYLTNIPHLIHFLFITILAIYSVKKYDAKFPVFVSQNLFKIRYFINDFKSKIYYCLSFKKLIENLEETFVKNLYIKSVKLYVVRRKKAKIDIPIYKKGKFAKILEKYKKDIVLLEEINYKKLTKSDKKVLTRTLKELDAVLCMPLFVENKLIGFLTLGEKANKKPYTQEEIEEILKIRHDLSICLMNLLLKHNMQEENNLMKEIIDKKTKKLRKQFQEIKSLLDQQTDFLAVTAHEFRTPLSIALFQLEDTLKMHKHAPEVIEDMEIMNKSLKDLKELTQRLFDIQQYDLKKVKLFEEKTNIIEFIKNIYTRFANKYKQKNIKFIFENNLTNTKFINIDKGQIKQVINNLLSNAIKFCDKKDGIIKLELNNKKNKIYIVLEDNGSGTPNKDKKRIFEKFQSVKATMGTGLGLGLYICKKIIELHGGEIWVEDSELGGAKFIIELTE
jgi:signal transduction histidine kinase